MTVIACVPDSLAAERVVEWTRALTDSDANAKFICLDKPFGKETELAVLETLTREERETWDLTTASAHAPINEIVDACRSPRAGTLVSAAFAFDNRGGRPCTSDELIRSAPCKTFVGLFGTVKPRDVRKILVVATGGAHDLTTLLTADALARKLQAKVTVATVEYESGDRAELAGEKAIRTLIHDAALDEERFEEKVVVDRLRHRGIRRCVDDHQLILIGRDGTNDVSPLRQTLTDTTAIAVKRSPPLRLQSLPDWIPRINPRDHADLLQNLRQGSRWGIDFIAMLALASGIASLGLMQNSPAVVIGSMLLAPLMTPMIGAGLALAQANRSLAIRCGQSIILGFLLTLAVSLLLGLVTPSRETLSPEVLSRGAPNVLDLLIALFAAMAATFAMARPNLSGAIAGVAIATALVPPVCAVGLSLSMGAFGNAIGATLLFVTNLLAIIVASSFTFTALGVSTVRSLPRHRHSAQWGRWGLVAVLIALSAPLSIDLLNQLDEGRTQTAVYPVTRAVSRALHVRVARDSGVDITFLGRPSVTDAVLIHIATDHDLPRSYAKELRAIVRETMNDEDLAVIVICLSGQWRSDDNGD
jgi:uncharacterized hydrophobic protein (TIGR00271 family)